MSWDEDSLPTIPEALRTLGHAHVVYEEHASRCVTELQAKEAARRASTDRRIVRMNGRGEGRVG